jgi:hypothetical protein
VDRQSISHERQKTKLFLSRDVLRLSFEVLKLSRPPMLGAGFRGLLSHSGCPGPGTGNRNTRTALTPIAPCGVRLTALSGDKPYRACTRPPAAAGPPRVPSSRILEQPQNRTATEQGGGRYSPDGLGLRAVAHQNCLRWPLGHVPKAHYA